MTWLCVGLSFALVGVVIYLQERREDRWHRRMSDLLNRKMAKDFYDYTDATVIMDKAAKMTPEQLRFAELEAAEKAIKEGYDKPKEPPFINAYRPRVEAKLS